MKNVILKLIAEHDGKLDWYKLDRLLMGKTGTVDGKMQSIKDLISEGLILEVAVDGFPSMPRYRITEKGWQSIQAQ